MHGNDNRDRTAESSNGGRNAAEETTDGSTALSAITRRRVLTASGTAAVGLTAFTGTASAHEVSTVAFCGCTQVTVYGALFGDGNYEAVLYCDGDTKTRTLTGTETRQNYDMDADETIGPGDDCQIIALKGTTYPNGSFTICNEHCPANCAAKGLEETDLHCDDPADIQSGGSEDGIDRQTITVQCSGCGRDEPGHPGRGGGKGKGKGRKRGR